jgi:hypothetical protein
MDPLIHTHKQNFAGPVSHQVSAEQRLTHPLHHRRRPVGRPLALVDLGVHPLRPDAEQDVQPEPDDTGDRHDHEHETVAVRADAGVAAARHRGGLRVVEEAGEEAREEEGAEGQVEDEDVVDEAVVLEPEQLRRRRHGDRQTHAVAGADHDRADEERAGHGERHHHIAHGHHDLRGRVPEWARNCSRPENLETFRRSDDSGLAKTKRNAPQISLFFRQIRVNMKPDWFV